MQSFSCIYKGFICIYILVSTSRSLRHNLVSQSLASSEFKRSSTHRHPGGELAFVTEAQRWRDDPADPGAVDSVSTPPRNLLLRSSKVARAHPHSKSQFNCVDPIREAGKTVERSLFCLFTGPATYEKNIFVCGLRRLFIAVGRELHRRRRGDQRYHHLHLYRIELRRCTVRPHERCSDLHATGLCDQRNVELCPFPRQFSVGKQNDGTDRDGEGAGNNRHDFRSR